MLSFSAFKLFLFFKYLQDGSDRKKFCIPSAVLKLWSLGVAHDESDGVGLDVFSFILHVLCSLIFIILFLQEHAYF